MANPRLKVPEVKVAGSPISADLAEALRELRVEQALNVPDTFTLRFDDATFDLFGAGTFDIGKEIAISFRDEDTNQQVIAGEITAVGVDQGPTGRHELVVSGYDKAHRLARGTVVRTFLNQKDSDIVGAIARERGLSSATDASATVHPYMLQETDDYAFISARARAVGFDWWVSNGTLNFKSRKAAGGKPTVTWGEDLRSFKVRISAGGATKNATVRGWDPATQKAIVGTAAPKGNAAELGSAAPAAAAQHGKMRAFGAARFSGRAHVADKGEADAVATAAVERGVGDEVIARGEAEGEPSLKPGIDVDVAGMGPKLSGTYFLTRVEHVYRAGDAYLTRFVTGGREPTGFVDLMARAAQEQRSELGGTLLVGVVTANDDPEGAGRVKVKYPALGDDIESDWARLVTLGAGPQRGIEWIPEVNDEVLVAFEHGDSRRALVLGGLWSKKHAPPVKTAQAVKSKEVVTRGLYSRLGHKVELHDGTSPKDKAFEVTLSDKKTKLHMGEDEVTLDAPTDISVTGKKKITVKATGDIDVQGANITIKAQNKLTLQATMIEIKGSANVKAQAPAIDIKGGGVLNADGGGVANIKGPIVKIN